MTHGALGAIRRVTGLNIWLALLSGTLLGLAFPPISLRWAVWVGLIPLLLAIDRSRRPLDALVVGALAGTVWGLLVLAPLVSAHAWSGWATETQASFAARVARQAWFLRFVVVTFALLGGGMFWGVWAAALKRFGRRPWQVLLLAPALWIVGPEWARAQVTFDFGWAFLGNACADFPAIRQLAALGGVWLLSGLVVLVNTALALALARLREPRSWCAPLVVACTALGVAWAWGQARLSRGVSEQVTTQAAVLQHAKPAYVAPDFDEVNLDQMYASMIEEAELRRCELIVVPESVALGAVSLDGTTAPEKPPHWHIPRTAWDEHLLDLLIDPDTLLLIGLYTVEGGQAYNSLVSWTLQGAQGWYHKRRLVPYAEYQPRGWRWALHGQDQYVPGRGSQLIAWNGHRIGGFICQEVLIPWVTRASVRDGAELLVSGGNDGMFTSPAVARIQADAAQLRAVENGRYVLRAMKTGVSAIIDPFGRELARAEINQLALLRAPVSFQRGLTPYTRYGEWVVWLAGLVSLIGFGVNRRPIGV